MQSNVQPITKNEREYQTNDHSDDAMSAVWQAKA